MKESNILDKKLAGKGLLKAIIESRKKKTWGKHVKKGTVLFPEEPADDDAVAETKKGNEWLNSIEYEKKPI